jgi:hypothetical protein
MRSYGWTGFGWARAGYPNTFQGVGSLASLPLEQNLAALLIAPGITTSGITSFALSLIFSFITPFNLTR